MSPYETMRVIADRHGVDLNMVEEADHGIMADYKEVTMGSDLSDAIEKDMDEAGISYGWTWFGEDRGHWTINGFRKPRP